MFREKKNMAKSQHPNASSRRTGSGFGRSSSQSRLRTRNSRFHRLTQSAKKPRSKSAVSSRATRGRGGPGRRSAPRKRGHYNFAAPPIHAVNQVSKVSKRNRTYPNTRNSAESKRSDGPIRVTVRRRKKSNSRSPLQKAASTSNKRRAREFLYPMIKGAKLSRLERLCQDNVSNLSDDDAIAYYPPQLSTSSSMMALTRPPRPRRTPTSRFGPSDVTPKNRYAPSDVTPKSRFAKWDMESPGYSEEYKLPSKKERDRTPMSSMTNVKERAADYARSIMDEFRMM